MLSKEKIDKLVLTGLYKHEPDKRYRPSIYWNDLYHCYNWTFRVKHREDDNTWLMVDTFFGDKSIELTDENFDEFEFVFDFNEVKKHSGENIEEFDDNDWWRVAIDSAGRLRCKYFVRKGATKNKEKILARIENEIKHLEQQIRYKKQVYERVMKNEVNLDYV